jgi:TolA-binding protein
MRFHLLVLALLAGAAVPATAQRTDSIDRRVDRLEQEMRAVQRRVFPGASGPVIGAEISERPVAEGPAGVPASSAVADLTARVDSLESQLRELTGLAEQNSNRVRQLEEGLARLRDTLGGRLDALERAPAADSAPSAGAASPRLPVMLPAATASSTAATSSAATSVPATGGADEAEKAYNAGFRLWEQKKYREAQTALEAVGKRYPNSKWASWANNLAGRAYLDDGKPAAAARLFLANYEGNRRGERAADSLFFLGQALMTLNKPADACKAYDELQDVYGDTMRAYLKQRLPAARAEAKCR